MLLLYFLNLCVTSRIMVSVEQKSMNEQITDRTNKIIMVDFLMVGKQNLGTQ